MKKGSPDVLSESDHILLNKISLLYEHWLLLTGPEPSIYDDFEVIPVDEKSREEFRKVSLERKNNYLGSTDKVISVKK